MYIIYKKQKIIAKATSTLITKHTRQRAATQNTKHNSREQRRKRGEEKTEKGAASEQFCCPRD